MLAISHTAMPRLNSINPSSPWTYYFKWFMRKEENLNKLYQGSSRFGEGGPFFRFILNTLTIIIWGSFTFSISCWVARKSCSPFLTHRRQSIKYMFRPKSFNHKHTRSQSHRENGISLKTKKKKRKLIPHVHYWNENRNTLHNITNK